MSTKTAPTTATETTEALLRESLSLVDDRARRIRQSLALVIQYTRAEALADHGGRSGFEEEAMNKLEELLIEIHCDFEPLMTWIDSATHVLRTLRDKPTGRTAAREGARP